jgi:hypothetical protein
MKKILIFLFFYDMYGCDKRAKQFEMYMVRAKNLSQSGSLLKITPHHIRFIFATRL